MKKSLMVLITASLSVAGIGVARAETSPGDDQGLVRRSGVLVSDGARAPVTPDCSLRYLQVAFLADEFPGEFGVPTINSQACQVVLPASVRGASLFAEATTGQLSANVSKEVAASGKRVLVPQVGSTGVTLVPLVNSLRSVQRVAEEVAVAVNAEGRGAVNAVETRVDPVTGLPVVTVIDGSEPVLKAAARGAAGREVIVEIRVDMAPTTLASRAR